MPSKEDDFLLLLAVGFVSVGDIALAEASRLIGFVGGHLGYSESAINDCHQGAIQEVHAEIATKLLEIAWREWKLESP